MKTTELLDVEQALQLIEHVLLRSGDEGQYLGPGPRDAPGSGRGGVQQRLATRKSLLAARNLLGVAARLMAEADSASSREMSVQMKAAIERLKLAARGAYEAGHLLVGVGKEPT